MALPEPAGRVARVNLLERQTEPLQVRDGGVQLELRPREIVTLCYELEGP